MKKFLFGILSIFILFSAYSTAQAQELSPEASAAQKAIISIPPWVFVGAKCGAEVTEPQDPPNPRAIACGMCCVKNGITLKDIKAYQACVQLCYLSGPREKAGTGTNGTF